MKFILGKNIKSLRERAGLNQRQLGEKLSLAESTISLYESGKREPDNNTLIKIADLFSVTTDVLLGKKQPIVPLELEPKKLTLEEALDNPGFVSYVQQEFEAMQKAVEALNVDGRVAESRFVVGVFDKLAKEQQLRMLKHAYDGVFAYWDGSFRLIHKK